MMDVTSVIRCYPGHCQPSRIEPLGGSGGLSGALFWRLTTPRRTLCLRRWPAEHPSGDRLERIHQAVRSAAAACPFPLPVPLNTTRGASFVESSGHLWELTPWLEGDPLPASAPELERIPIATTALAELHLALAGFAARTGELRWMRIGPAAGIAKRLALLRGLDSRQVHQAAVGHGGKAAAAPLRRLGEIVAARWSALSTTIRRELETASRLRVPQQPCLRDVWRPHVLFQGSKVSGIIDFGGLDVDAVAADISRLLGSFTRTDGADSDVWERGLAAYGAVRPLSREERLLVATYDRSGVLLSAWNWLRWLALERRSFPDPATVDERLDHLAERLQSLGKTAETHPALLEGDERFPGRYVPIVSR